MLVAPAEVSGLCRCKAILKIRLGFVVGVPFFFFPLFDSKHYGNAVRSCSYGDQWSCATDPSVREVQRVDIFPFPLFARRRTSGLAWSDC